MARTLLITAFVLAINLIYFAIQIDPRKRAHFARTFALWMMLGFALLGGLFTAGYALADPGGAEGGLLIAFWAIPLVVLSTLAWLKYKIVKSILWVFLISAVIVNLISILFKEQDWTFFNDRGPWLAIGSFVFTIVATVYGYHMDARLAGWMNITIAMVPLAVTLIAFDPQAALAGGSTAAALTPGFTAGILLLISDKFARSVIN